MIHAMVKRALKAQAGTIEDAAQLQTIATHVRAAEPGAPELAPLSDHIAELKKLVDEKTGTVPIDTTRSYGGFALGGQAPGVPEPGAAPAGGADDPAGEPAVEMPASAPSAPSPAPSEADAKKGAGGDGGGGGNGGGNGLANALEAITAYIPAEILGIYITLTAFMAPKAEEIGTKWGIFGICVALIPFLAWLSHRILVKDKVLPANAKFGTARMLGLVLLPAIAFAVWAATLPETPFLIFSDDISKFAGAGVIVLAAVMPQLARAFDLETPNGG